MAKIKKEKPTKSPAKGSKIKTTGTAADVKFKAKAKSPKKNIIKVKLPKHDAGECTVLSPKEFESKFPIKISDIKKAVDGVIKFAQTNPKLKNQLFNEKVPLFLQLNCFKIPKGHPKIIRIPLKNSLVSEDDEVCLIVPEVKGIPNKEHERHQEHYEELLRNKGVGNIKKIMTMHEMRTEYDTFELKKRLVDLYEHFLVGGEVSGKTVNFLGSIFYEKRKVPTSVKLQASNLKSNIEKALSKTQFLLNNKGDSFMVQFGNSDMDLEVLAENVVSCVDFLAKEFPGGFDNVRSYNIYSFRASSIPIYLSTKNPTEIAVPRVKTKKPKAYKTYTGELTTKLNAEVVVQPTGEVIVKGEKKSPQAKAQKKIKAKKLIKKEPKKVKTKLKKEKQEKEENNNVNESVKEAKIKEETTNGSPAKNKRKLKEIEIKKEVVKKPKLDKKPQEKVKEKSKKKQKASLKTSKIAIKKPKASKKKKN